MMEAMERQNYPNYGPMDQNGRTNMSHAGVGPDGVYCHIIQMRGLPFRASEEEIRFFFAPISVSAVQFEFGFDSRPTGRASVAFATHKDAEKAMEKDKNTIGNRYIELFLKSSERSPATGISSTGQYLHMLQMRGLPFKITPKDVVNFFAPIRLLDISLEMGQNGPNGSGKVAFYTLEDLKVAQKKDKEHIGDRYIELFPVRTPRIPKPRY